MEEVGRMIGYASIPIEPPAVPTTPPLIEAERMYHREVRAAVAAQGFTEVYNYSFVNAAQLARFGMDPAEHIRVANPISVEQSLLRTSLLPNIVRNIEDNARHFDSFRLFEIGYEIHRRAGELPDEVPHLMAAIFGRDSGEAGLMELKRLAECVMAGASVRSVEARSYEHPARAAEVIWRDKAVGRLYELHPSIVEGRAAILGRTPDRGQKLDYQAYRLGFRDIASNTNERTMVSSLLPPTFHGNKIPTVCIFDDEEDRFIADDEQLFLCAAWNSYVLDYMVRMKVTTTLNFFYVYQLPVPRLTVKDAAFAPIVERAARLVCTTPEFDELAKEVGLKSYRQGATDPAERARLRAELDGLVAHLYGLTEEEFAYILTTFPLVPAPVKVAAHNAYRDVERGRVK